MYRCAPAGGRFQQAAQPQGAAWTHHLEGTAICDHCNMGYHGIMINQWQFHLFSSYNAFSVTVLGHNKCIRRIISYLMIL